MLLTTYPEYDGISLCGHCEAAAVFVGLVLLPSILTGQGLDSSMGLDSSTAQHLNWAAA